MLIVRREVGELFKAIRKKGKVTKIDQKSIINSVDEELVDIIIVMCTIANRLDIDLEKSFRDKEEINKKRVWK